MELTATARTTLQVLETRAKWIRDDIENGELSSAITHLDSVIQMASATRDQLKDAARG